MKKWLAEVPAIRKNANKWNPDVQRRNALIAGLVVKGVTYAECARLAGIGKERARQIVAYVRRVELGKQYRAEQKVYTDQRAASHLVFLDSFSKIVPQPQSRNHSTGIVFYRRRNLQKQLTNGQFGTDDLTYYAPVDPTAEGRVFVDGWETLRAYWAVRYRLGEVGLEFPARNRQAFANHFEGLDATFTFYFTYKAWQFNLNVELEPGGEISWIVPPTLKLHKRQQYGADGKLENLTHLVYDVKPLDMAEVVQLKDALHRMRRESINGGILLSLKPIPQTDLVIGMDLLYTLSLMKRAVDQVEAPVQAQEFDYASTTGGDWLEDLILGKDE